MHGRSIGALVLAAALTLAGCAAEDTTAADIEIEGAIGLTDEPTESATPAASWTGTCSYVLGDFSENTETGFAFVAQGDVENDGAGTVTVEVVASWDQIGTDPITETQRVTVAEGESETVKFNRPVGQREISRLQELPTDKQCSVEPTIVYVDTSRH